MQLEVNRPILFLSTTKKVWKMQYLEHILRKEMLLLYWNWIQYFTIQSTEISFWLPATIFRSSQGWSTLWNLRSINLFYSFLLPKKFGMQYLGHRQVILWLINSMQLEVNKPFLLLSTTKKVWKMQYLVHILRKEMLLLYWNWIQYFAIQSREISLWLPTTTLMVLWQELDLYLHLEMTTPDDAMMLEEMLEWDRVF